jgi:hypothetical protein
MDRHTYLDGCILSDLVDDADEKITLYILAAILNSACMLSTEKEKMLPKSRKIYRVAKCPLESFRLANKSFRLDILME